MDQWTFVHFTYDLKACEVKQSSVLEPRLNRLTLDEIKSLDWKILRWQFHVIYSHVPDDIYFKVLYAVCVNCQVFAILFDDVW